MIFDTNILIYADRGVFSAKELIMNTPERSISAVIYMDYVLCCRNKRELAVFEKNAQGAAIYYSLNRPLYFLSCAANGAVIRIKS